MHNFCLTIPYGLLVLAGGFLAFIKKGSTASLAGGGGSGLVLLLAGYLSLKAFEKRKNSYFAMFLETGTVLYLFFIGVWENSDPRSELICVFFVFDTVCAFGLTYIMGKRYIETSKIMPAGVVAVLRQILNFHECFLF